MISRRGLIGLAVALTAYLSLGAADAAAQTLRFFVVNSANNGIYEVVPGSVGGGKFIEQPRNVGGVYVRGYTDRAKRGEFVLLHFGGSGTAQYIGFRSDNKVINVRAYNVGLPTWAFGRVWLNPNVDNVYVLAKMPYAYEVSKRLPIGTRP